tara:strand:- start:348 stop:542 length:195 start_codon:yes stop_codon:yes gene_type:complete
MGSGNSKTNLPHINKKRKIQFIPLYKDNQNAKKQKTIMSPVKNEKYFVKPTPIKGESKKKLWSN